MTAAVEAVFRVWLGDTGDRIEIGEDSDGFGLVEIRHVAELGKVVAEIRFDEEYADTVMEALDQYKRFKAQRKP